MPRLRWVWRERRPPVRPRALLLLGDLLRGLWVELSPASLQVLLRRVSWLQVLRPSGLVWLAGMGQVLRRQGWRVRSLLLVLGVRRPRVLVLGVRRVSVVGLRGLCGGLGGTRLLGGWGS
ncbi:hypothetical protein JOF29_006595 [Kribbella aluminosa]|uniref:Uncharacterized protein n=1 Tax=Kribbella aluminosa TaxID=416017 RepID=A0ABS4UV44_9ACTN|nr:hypothetical protein [Kribbella aluminosa]MBP2355485.1 hypothetical protein [Kribbella aluminosa]